MQSNQITHLLQEALDQLALGTSQLPAHLTAVDEDAIRTVLQEVANRMHDNFPYVHPLYAGQMLQPPHPIARIAYALAQAVNPNNHALDGGRASSQMEKEAVAEIASMMGWTEHLGHLTSGGTMANLEALWISGLLRPAKKVVASQQGHYTHERITAVLKIPFSKIAADEMGRMDLVDLERQLETGEVGTVVVTLGTTAFGQVDPLVGVLALRKRYDFRVHVDAAYGGYYRLLDSLSPYVRAQFQALEEVDSIVIDPHKHGLQPYGCGCILLRDPAVGRFYKHDSPYTYFSSDELHLGEISLECSRAGASAVALWATQRLLPLTTSGSFAHGLRNCHDAALKLYRLLNESPRWRPVFSPDLDIVVWAPVIDSNNSRLVSQASWDIYHRAEKLNLHLAVTQVPREFLKDWPLDWQSENLACLRSCLMKTQHLDWVPKIWEILEQSFS
jgi:tyrosine decarboxylase / aspartate 1-decarboxylase